MHQPWMNPIIPEEAGLSSRAIEKFLRRLERERIRMHSFMVLRDNQVLAEGYWNPMSPEKPHRMFSVSKSFTSVAIGMLCDEGKLSLDARVAEFFPDKLPEKLHPYIEAATVRDLLCMTSPHAMSSYKLMPGDWVASFFRLEPSHPAGTLFSYDTSASHVLGALVERVSGLKLLEYLRTKALNAMGFGDNAFWIPDPYGIPMAGSGLCCTTRDFARFGLLCLNGGEYEGTRYVSADYMKEATSRQVSNSLAGNCYVVRGQGYGYQFWCGIDDLFSCFGMGGQYAIMSPSRRLLVVTTADTQIDPGDEGNIVTAIWEELFCAVSDGPLPEDAAAHESLQETIASLRHPVAAGNLTSPLSESVSGSRWTFFEGDLGVSELELQLSGSRGELRYTKASGEYRLEFGIGENLATTFPEGEYDCLASAAWIQDTTLEIWACIIDDTPGTVKILLSFKGDEIALRMHKSLENLLEDYSGFAGGQRML